MGILNIHEAQREGARVVVGLGGASGSGKTHTAILLAYGMTNFNSSKIGFLDTENKRGSLFSDILKNEDDVIQPFLIGDLVPPFSPDRYVQAIREFEAAGVEVLIIDSVTHEWEGTGGCAEIADNFIGGNPKRTALGWATAKKGHKQFINTLLQCDMHIICCIRAREQTSFKNPSKPVSLGIQPIQEKNFMFEMTASLLMLNEGTAQQPLKCPTDLKQFFGRGNGYITSQDGLALREWVDGGKKIDKDRIKYENRLLANAEQGLIHIKKCWDKTPDEIRELLGSEFKNTLFASAEGYDNLNKKHEEPVPGGKLAGRIKIKQTDQKPNPLHATPEWKEWIEICGLFPDITGKMQPPVDIAQCVAATQIVKQQVDAENAA